MNAAEAWVQRRAHDRAALRLDVLVRHRDERYSGWTENVSLGGMLLVVPGAVDLKIADPIRLSFVVPAAESSLEIRAEVRWIRETWPVAYGIQFVSGMRAADTRALLRFMNENGVVR